MYNQLQICTTSYVLMQFNMSKMALLKPDGSMKVAMNQERQYLCKDIRSGLYLFYLCNERAISFGKVLGYRSYCYGKRIHIAPDRSNFWNTGDADAMDPTFFEVKRRCHYITHYQPITLDTLSGGLGVKEVQPHATKRTESISRACDSEPMESTSRALSSRWCM